MDLNYFVDLQVEAIKTKIQEKKQKEKTQYDLKFIIHKH
jgi:hypothetical protein